jgi:hypothetical protein
MPSTRLNTRLEQVNVDDNRFDLFVDGERAFICEREYVTIRGVPQRGYWLLKMVTGMGPLIVERDQYSNDIRERVEIHVHDRQVYGKRFRIECIDRSYYEINVNDWLSDVSTLFPGHWSGYYDDFNNWAILEKD